MNLTTLSKKSKFLVIFLILSNLILFLPKKCEATAPLGICGNFGILGVAGKYLFRVIMAGVIYDGVRWLLSDILYEYDGEIYSEKFPEGTPLSKGISLNRINKKFKPNPAFLNAISDNFSQEKGTRISIEETCSGDSCHTLPDRIINVANILEGEECCYVIFIGASFSEYVPRMAVCTSIFREYGGGGEPNCKPQSCIPFNRFLGLYAFSEIRDLPERTGFIYHDWYKNGQLADSIRLRVLGMQRYRTWSHKRNGLVPGHWEVLVRWKGRIIGSYIFEICK